MPTVRSKYWKELEFMKLVIDDLKILKGQN